MSDELRTAINLLCYILGGNHEPTTEALVDLYEIKQGNKKVILEHLKAVHSIFDVAIEDLLNILQNGSDSQ